MADMENAIRAVTAYAESDSAEIRAVAEYLGIAVAFGEPEGDAPVLRISADGLTLTHGTLSMRGDFTRMLPRLKTPNLRSELLVRAAKTKCEGTPTAVDATAGLGEDSLLLAAAGFEVRLYERDAVIAALLRDTLRRAADIPELKDAVSRMTLYNGDSLTELPKLVTPPDVIYLDPMFPERRKSALVKKKFQLLHFLESPCDDGMELINAALAANPRKIIVKRPSKEPCLAGIKPGYSVEGKGIRYDCIVCRT